MCIYISLLDRYMYKMQITIWRKSFSTFTICVKENVHIPMKKNTAESAALKRSAAQSGAGDLNLVALFCLGWAKIHSGQVIFCHPKGDLCQNFVCAINCLCQNLVIYAKLVALNCVP